MPCSSISEQLRKYSRLRSSFDDSFSSTPNTLRRSQTPVPYMYLHHFKCTALAPKSLQVFQTRSWSNAYYTPSCPLAGMSSSYDLRSCSRHCVAERLSSFPCRVYEGIRLLAAPCRCLSFHGQSARKKEKKQQNRYVRSGVCSWDWAVLG